MSFVDSVKDTITNHYADFNGHAQKSEFVNFILLYIGVGIVNSILTATDIPFIGALIAILQLALLLPMLGVTARRLRTVGQSPWLTLLYLIPLIGLIVILVMCLKDDAPGGYGTPGQGGYPQGGYQPGPQGY